MLHDEIKDEFSLFIRLRLNSTFIGLPSEQIILQLFIEEKIFYVNLDIFFVQDQITNPEVCHHSYLWIMTAIGREK